MSHHRLPSFLACALVLTQVSFRAPQQQPNKARTRPCVLCVLLRHLSMYAARFASSPAQVAADASSGAQLVSTRWTLARRPSGPLSEADFELVTQPALPSGSLPAEHVLVKVTTLSIDAFIRTMLDEGAFHGAVPLGGTIPALGLGEVIASNSRTMKPGTLVAGLFGAQTYALVRAAEASKVSSLPGIPLEAMLAELGFTSGLTAWAGVHSVLAPPRRGELVVVSGAAGAVGAAAAQFARNRGARVIGISRASKAPFLLDTLGLAGAIDYRNATHSVGAQLDELAPGGVDFFFDNVGGEVLDAVLDRIRPGGRIVICGAISQYDAVGGVSTGVVRGPASYLKLAERGATMAGFAMTQKLRLLPWMFIRAAVAYWRGKLRLPRHVECGIERFPAALLLMFSGGHTGKLLVRL